MSKSKVHKIRLVKYTAKKIQSIELIEKTRKNKSGEMETFLEVFKIDTKERRAWATYTTKNN